MQTIAYVFTNSELPNLENRFEHGYIFCFDQKSILNERKFSTDLDMVIALFKYLRPASSYKLIYRISNYTDHEMLLAKMTYFEEMKNTIYIDSLESSILLDKSYKAFERFLTSNGKTKSYISTSDTLIKQLVGYSKTHDTKDLELRLLELKKLTDIEQNIQSSVFDLFERHFMDESLHLNLG